MRPAALRRGLLSLLSALVLLPLFPALASADPALPQGFQDTEVFKGLEQPTAVRFAPNGMVFVAEKAGKILVYENLQDETPELFKDLRTEVYNHADRGLLGLAVDPSFPTKPYVYALFTYDHVLGSNEPAPEWGEPNQTGDVCPELHGADDCLVSGRLVRYTAEITGAPGNLHVAAGEQKPLIPEAWCQQFSSHSIGDLRFGPEGALYASGGDGASFSSPDYGQLGSPPNPCGDPPDEGGSLRSQDILTPATSGDPTGLNGTIIRIDPATGAGWPTNPKHGSQDENERRIVAFGFRNPFRFTTDPATQRVYVANVGGSQFEEIDRFDPSSGTLYNSGWPCYEGDGPEYQFKEFEQLDLCNELYHETEVGGPGAPSDPFFYYSHKQTVVPADECDFTSGSAISGLSFYEGDDFPAEYKGALFFSDSVRNCIYVMLPGADGHPDPSKVEPFLTGGSNYPGVDIQEGPDGALYYASLFGENFTPGAIHRITYAPGAPKARLSVTPQWGDVLPLHVELDASESSDPNEPNDQLEFEWDLDGNGSFETDGGETQSVNLTEPVNTVLSVRVKDGDENTSVARVTVYPGDSPPVPTITSPQPSLTWKVGDQIHFEGSAVDGEGHEIDNSLYFYWSSWLYHCPGGGGCHAHPLQVAPGVSKGDLLAPEHDYPSYIEISFSVTDERGLRGTETVRIDPRTVDVQIASEPPGVPIVAGLFSEPAPFDVTAIMGAQLVLSAPQTTELNGQTYNWQGWSDQGARSHSIVANSSGTYTAVYSAAAGPPSPPPTPGIPPSPPTPSPPSPGTKLRKHPPKSTRSTTAKFTFGADEAGADFTCKLDGRAKAPCRSPKTYKRLKPGRHGFKVWASAGGLTDATPSKFSWKILPRKR